MENNEEIDLKELLNVFWEKKVIIVIMLVIAVIVGLVYTMYLKEPKYTSSATLILVQKDGGEKSTTVTQADVTLNDKLIATYKELASSNSIIREVISNLGLSGVTEKELKSEINVTAVKETQILEVSVTDKDPIKAQRVAKELSEVFCKKVAEIYKIDNVNIVDEAEIPSNPSNINHKKDIAIFAGVGLVLAIGTILIINLFDTTIKSSADIEKALDLMVLAEIPDCDFEGK